MVGLYQLLLIAGNITTTYLITNTFRCFAEQPELLGRFEADDSELALGPVTEEVLRYRSLVQDVARVATKSTQVRGQAVSVGERFVCFL